MKMYMNTSCELEDDICGYPWDMLACSLGLIVTMVVDNIPNFLQDKKENRQCSKPKGNLTDDEDNTETANYGAAGHGHGHGHTVGTKSPIVAYILFAALSFHSFMAGLALGVSDDAFNALLLAILAHKGFAAFALGTEFVRMETGSNKSDEEKDVEEGEEEFGDGEQQKWCLTPTGTTVRIASFMGTFCLVTPIGVMIGTFALQDAGGLVIAVLTAVAAGTFLYVGIVEVTVAELMGKAHEGRTGLKLSFVLAGYALMALLGVWS